MPRAHSKNTLGQPHDLVEHLQCVAKLAGNFAAKFGARDLAYQAGLWHDIGKVHPAFQRYLQDCEINPGIQRQGPDHKMAGALLATGKAYDPLAFLIAGHHGGLPARSGLKTWFQHKEKVARAAEANRLIRQYLDVETPSPLSFPGHLRSDLDAEFFIRMLFSTLVDADFLDTERHFNTAQADQRRGMPDLASLWERFQNNQKQITGKVQNHVNRVRHEVYKACLQAADLPQGFFSLTVPTGGGKTRSGIAFALRHVLAHQLDRVIVAIPYTSIIEQTADVYRQIFGDGVLEHHSAVVPENPRHDPVSLSEVWSRLAAENWDAPLVVTTTVQLFESLLDRRTTACRKLHNIARSVLILDEVQTLPLALLEPILDTLHQLVAHYNVSVVLCTATQPALEDSPYLKGLKEDVREIVPEPARFFAELKRVEYSWPNSEERWTWERVAEEIQSVPQALTILNTKSDALAVLDSLQNPEALHLSTLLCGAHRRAVLEEVRQRLAEEQPCHLISTQVVEAGVDLDFPLVLRAIGPLDRIVQAAGRCNREGKLAFGRVVVFEPLDGKLPPGNYQTATAASRSLLAPTDSDFHDLGLYRKYFHSLYQVTETDTKKIQALRKILDYPKVAERFRMIDDDSVAVIVRYRGQGGTENEIDRLLSHLRHQEDKLPRWLLRQLQPYIVNVRTRLIDGYQRDGLLSELTPGLWEWLGKYDAVRGLTVENRDPAELVI